MPFRFGGLDRKSLGTLDLFDDYKCSRDDYICSRQKKRELVS